MGEEPRHNPEFEGATTDQIQDRESERRVGLELRDDSTTATREEKLQHVDYSKEFFSVFGHNILNG